MVAYNAIHNWKNNDIGDRDYINFNVIMSF